MVDSVLPGASITKYNIIKGVPRGTAIATKYFTEYLLSKIIALVSRDLVDVAIGEGGCTTGTGYARSHGSLSPGGSGRVQRGVTYRGGEGTRGWLLVILV